MTLATIQPFKLLAGAGLCKMILIVVAAIIMIIPSQLFAKAFTTSSTSLAHNHHVIHHRHYHHDGASSILHSTPFDLDMYDNFNTNNDDDEELTDVTNPYQPSDSDDSQQSPLAQPPSTNLTLGINKYSHDTTLIAANSQTGKILFGLSKERITRTKHDGGNIASLVESCLDQLDLDIDNIQNVVMNNHHYRILPIESNVNHMEWEEGLGINAGSADSNNDYGYSDEYNVLSSVPNKMEISHHLAHAYSVVSQCPFDTGLVVVMDGMGETWRTMYKAMIDDDDSYVSDLTLCADGSSYEDIQFIPSDIEERAKTSYFDWREAESVYTFSKQDGMNLSIKVRLISQGNMSCVKYCMSACYVQRFANDHMHLSSMLIMIGSHHLQTLTYQPVFKRFTQENSPPTLYNHGFENMDSLGAVYSRASSHIFGDWNAW